MKKGDRIELIAMPDDPCPIESGTRGTIEDVIEMGYKFGKQVQVKWDNGRSLSLCIPPDIVRVIPTP